MRHLKQAESLNMICMHIMIDKQAESSNMIRMHVMIDKHTEMTINDYLWNILKIILFV